MSYQIATGFPGGNVVVEEIHGDSVRMHQDLRDTPHDWFYWCFRVRGAAGRTLRFTFTRSRALGVRGPALSRDGGRTWVWLGAEVVDGNGFSTRFGAGDDDVRLSFAMPYQEHHWVHFVSGLGDSPVLSCRKLCTTEQGREVEVAFAGCQEAEPRHRVVITCRHHCCEMMANYALEGFIQGLVIGVSDTSHWLREKVQFLIVPFVDKDGVETGDQGKDRRPRDHGRDYEGESLYASTGALRRLLPDWGQGRLRAVFDLHCPHIAGPHNEVIYLVGSAQEAIATEQKRFSEILESVATGPLPFHARDFLAYGESWNCSANYGDGLSFPGWGATIPGIVLSSGIEIPYANASGHEVEPGSLRAFGVDLSVALSAYLQTLP